MAKDINKGDRVGILAYNSHRYKELIFAAAKIGAILVPINYRLNLSDSVHIILDSGLKILFISHEFTDKRDTFKEHFNKLEFVEISKNYEYMDSFKDTIESYPETEPDIQIEENDLLTLCYTSGTTGVPKGVLRDHRSLEVNTNL